MAAPEPTSVGTRGTPVLALLPTGRDAELVARALKRADVVCSALATAADLIERIDEDAGPVLLAEEALNERHRAALAALLDTQPKWSDLPVIILARARGAGACVATLAERPGTTLLRRPISSAALLSVMRSAVEARRRQFAVRDLLETQRRMARRLERRRDDLQRLTRELMTAEERERRRIAEDVHDNLGQLLNVAKMRISVLRLSVNGDTGRELEQVEAVLRQASDATRSLTHRLAPPILYELGLDSALGWLADEIEVLVGLRVSLTLDSGSGDIAEDIRVALYRATRELLLNVARHARVDQAEVMVRREADTLRIVVEDCGMGFEPSGIDDREEMGFGLFSVRERVAAFGGELHIRSAPGKGTRAEIVIGVGGPQPERSLETAT